MSTVQWVRLYLSDTVPQINVNTIATNAEYLRLFIAHITSIKSVVCSLDGAVWYCTVASCGLYTVNAVTESLPVSASHLIDPWPILLESVCPFSSSLAMHAYA